MSLASELSRELQDLAAVSPPDTSTISVATADGIELSVDVTGVDAMSCSFRELRLLVPALAATGADVLRGWAEEVCRRVTYLLENIGPLEVDEQNQSVLIRSTPPDRREEETLFYEVVLQSRSGGRFSLSRFRSKRDGSAREQVDVQITQETLAKLINDLEASIPAAA